jgi:hypothetical protein
VSPIRPENKSRYPANWVEIRTRILARAKHRCEWEGCGVENRSWGYWLPTGRFQTVSKGKIVATYLPERRKNPKPPTQLGVRDQYGERDVKVIEIVLTIAHLDHKPENCHPMNLRAWCQKHHNQYDAKMRARGRQEREIAAQMKLEI